MISRVFQKQERWWAVLRSMCVAVNLTQDGFHTLFPTPKKVSRRTFRLALNYLQGRTLLISGHVVCTVMILNFEKDFQITGR